MNFYRAIKNVAGYTLFTWATAAFAHVSLETTGAPVGNTYKVDGSANWNEVPAAGAATRNLKLPAPLLEVVALSAPTPGQTPMASQPVQVSGAWVRATVPGQKGSGAFMKMTSKTATRLVGVSSPVAGVAEVHEMKMDGDVMKMRAVEALDLPAGKTVDFKSGGYHIMLMDLKQNLPPGSTVPLVLRFRDAKGAESRLDLSLPVGLTAPSEAPGAGAEVHKH
jgi:copper(I)-binding protein